MRFLLIVLLGLLSCTSRPNPKPQAARRVVSLSPHITEIMYALGQQERLIAVTDYCNYPPQVKQKQRIGGLLNPNMEKMVALHADLFIGTLAHKPLADKLAAQNIPSVLFANDHLPDILSSIDSVGNLLDCRPQADSLTRSIRDSLAKYRQSAAVIPAKPRALFIIGREPGSTRKLTAVGSGSFITELWTELGAENIFAQLPSPYSLVSREAILEQNPDIIIEFKFLENWDENKQRKNIREWADLRNVQAVRSGDIYVLTADYTLIPGPRLYLLAHDYLNILRNFGNQRHN